MATDNFSFYFQNRLTQAGQTGGQWYSDTSPFSIPWIQVLASLALSSQAVRSLLRTPGCQSWPKNDSTKLIKKKLANIFFILGFD
jgi:hypothetical protein